MTRKSRLELAKRVLGYPARATLGTVMSLAVILLERRIRKALRSGGEPARPPAPAS